MYPTIGIMSMPVNFKYRDVARKGRPVHQKWDSFWMKHPPMGAARWAKIFAPFDALDGFDERIAEKEVLYTAKKELCEDDQKILDRRLNILHNLTWNGRMARANKPSVDVIHFVPCEDKHNFSFGIGGRYETISGSVVKADQDTLILSTEDGEVRISFNDIREITSKSNIFEKQWDYL